MAWCNVSLMKRLFKAWAALEIAASGAAAAAEMPAPRDGLWRVEQSAPFDAVYSVCVGPKTRAAPPGEAAWKAAGLSCSASSSRRGGALEVATSCVAPGGVSATARSEFSGDFGRAYRSSTQASLKLGEAAAAVEWRSESALTWISPCPAGMGDGDVDAPGRPRASVLGPAGG